MEHLAPTDAHALISAGNPAFPAPATGDALAWAVVTMQAGARTVIDEALLAAYQAASSRHSMRALLSDLAAFDHCAATSA